MMIHRPGAQPHGCVPTLITRGVDQFCLAGMVWFWKAPKGFDSAEGLHPSKSCTYKGLAVSIFKQRKLTSSLI
jgi:hypothetical protein